MDTNLIENKNNKKTVKTFFKYILYFFLAIIILFFVVFSANVGKYIKDINQKGINQNLQTKISKTLKGNIPEEEKNKNIEQIRKEIETKSDPTLGIPDAKVTVVEFGDFQCPYTRQMYPIMKKIQSEYEDRVLFIWRDLPLYDIHPDAIRAAMAGECAREQGKFWEMHDLMFTNQENLSRSSLIQYAQKININIKKFKQCLDSDKYRNEVMDDFQTAINHGAEGTPTFFINGEKFSGVIPYELLKSIIDNKLISK